MTAYKLPSARYFLAKIDGALQGGFTAGYSIGDTDTDMGMEIEWTEKSFSVAGEAIEWLKQRAASHDLPMSTHFKDDGSVDFVKMSEDNRAIIDNFQETLGELLARSQSQTVLYTASLLDTLLKRLLLKSMTALTKTLTEKLFGPQRPLSSFSAKIDVCHAFGLLDMSLYKDLSTLRKIRNKFAHPDGRPTFDRDDIALMCRQFTSYRSESGAFDNFKFASGAVKKALSDASPTI